MPHGQPVTADVPGKPKRIAGRDELRIRLADKFDGETCDPVPGGERAGQKTGLFVGPAPPDHPEQDDKQDKPFEEGLVKLRRVAGADAHDIRAELCGLTGKCHSPGHVGRTPPKLGVDEVRDATQQQAGRCSYG